MENQQHSNRRDNNSNQNHGQPKRRNSKQGNRDGGQQNSFGNQGAGGNRITSPTGGGQKSPSYASPPPSAGNNSQALQNRDTSAQRGEVLDGKYSARSSTGALSPPNSTHSSTGGGGGMDFFFPTGGFAEIVTFEDETRTGEILAFDSVTKFVALKVGSHDAGGKNLSRITILNLGTCKSAKIVKEPPENFIAPAMPKVDWSKVTQKLEHQLDRKRRSFTTSDVTLEGQKLFLYIQKTIDEIGWKGKNISVMRSVQVQAPYAVENVVADQQQPGSSHGPRNSIESAVEHVKKIVTKFHREKAIADKDLSHSGIADSMDSLSVSQSSNIAEEEEERVVEEVPPQSSPPATPRITSYSQAVEGT